MQMVGVGRIEGFPFIDAPDNRLIKDGYRVLEEIGAVTNDRKVTRLGKRLSRLPVDPRISSRFWIACNHGDNHLAGWNDY